MNEKKIKKPVKGWTAVKNHVKEWTPAQFTALLKDIYKSSVDNRNFLDARVQAASGGGEALEAYRESIVAQFFPKRGFGKLKMGEARKAVRDYKKAADDMDGVIELLLTFLESGNDFTCEYGDIDERFYDSLCSVMDDLAKAIKAEGPISYENVRERLGEVAANAEGIGWGYGDHIGEVTAELRGYF